MAWKKTVSAEPIQKLLHEFLNGIIHMFDCREIAILGGMDQTVLEMLLDAILAELVQFAFDRCQLDQDIGTVVIVLDHCLDFVEMTDGAGQFVGDFFHLGRIMGMCMRVLVFHGYHYTDSQEKRKKIAFFTEEKNRYGIVMSLWKTGNSTNGY